MIRLVSVVGGLAREIRYFRLHVSPFAESKRQGLHAQAADYVALPDRALCLYFIHNSVYCLYNARLFLKTVYQVNRTQ